MKSYGKISPKKFPYNKCDPLPLADWISYYVDFILCSTQETKV